MKLINLNGILINLDNVMYMEKIYPGHKDWIGIDSFIVDSYQIRFYPSTGDYVCVTYGKNESQRRNDWHWLTSFVIKRTIIPPRTTDGGDE